MKQFTAKGIKTGIMDLRNNALIIHAPSASIALRALKSEYSEIKEDLQDVTGEFISNPDAFSSRRSIVINDAR